MKIWMLAGAASVALNVLCLPASAAIPTTAATAPAYNAGADQAVSAFYARRGDALLWLRNGPDSPAARSMIDILQRSPLDGFASGPALAARATGLIANARSGDRAALAAADRLLSTAWVLYVQALHRAPPGMTMADGWSAPRAETAQQILTRAAAAQAPAAHVRTVSSVNPVYAQLRDAAWQQFQASSGALDPRVAASLDRARVAPFQKRYVMVDAASARLYMIEDGRIADSMRVVVGKPSTPTPMLASTLYYATVNPYWHVTSELVQQLIAPNVVEQGVGYLQTRGYQAFTSYGDDAKRLSPESIDWKAVAAGRESIEVRQLPGPANSMGEVKFGFANKYDIYLHDTPNKGVFAVDDRDISHGCIRLEDAAKLERWLLGREAARSDIPEQHVALPTPVPIYITYLTAQADGGQLAFVEDIYGIDSARVAQVATIR